MTENTPNNDPFDDYLLGKLSAEEMAAMDASIAADSQLQEDMLLQRDIVHALQEERRLELKNRLNNIEVGAEGFSSAVGLKIAAGVALLGILGAGLYFYSSEPATEEQGSLPIGLIELPQDSEQLAYIVPERPGATLAIPTFSAPAETAVPAAQADRAPIRSTAETRSTSVKAESRSAIKEEKVAVHQPQIQVQKPKVLSDFKESDITSNAQQLEAPVDAMARNQQFSTQSIEISAQAHEKWDFHYRFFDSKLFIYGDFKSKPYEILEINTDGTTRYFLYFENNYYGLKHDQQKLTKLRKLTHDKLIKELDITRSQKINPKHY